MIWAVLLLVHVLLLYLVLTRRSRSKTDPPLDKGLIPWLGHALEFGQDASKFLSRMKHKHGDIFTVRAAGRYVTVLLDPHLYDPVVHNQDSLDFHRYAQVLMERIFLLQLPNYQPAKEKAAMKPHFLGKNLCALNSTVSKHMQNLLKTEMPQNQTDWKEDGLFNLSYSLLFKVGYLTLFAGEQSDNSPDLATVYEEYKKFDGLLTKLARGALRSADEKKTAQSVRQKLWQLLAPAGLNGGPWSTPWLHEYRQVLREEGADDDMQTRALLLQLWATQGNVGPAAFWLLGYLLTNPEALAAVKTEMEALRLPLLDSSVVTPVLDSALDETLRLAAAPFITREVVQDTPLHMADGQRFVLRKGDRLCLFPFISPQMDPEIYQEPQIYKFNRFLNEDGSVKKDFFKGGRRLKYYNMPWGAGLNGCMGKEVAIATLKQFVYMILTKYDLELCDPRAQIPAIDASRYGYGMLQPEGDLLVRYKPKKTL